MIKFGYFLLVTTAIVLVLCSKGMTENVGKGLDAKFSSKTIQDNKPFTHHNDTKFVFMLHRIVDRQRRRFDNILKRDLKNYRYTTMRGDLDKDHSRTNYLSDTTTMENKTGDKSNKNTEEHGEKV